MHYLNDPGMHGTLLHMVIMWVALAVIAAAALLMIIALVRRAEPEALSLLSGEKSRLLRAWRSSDPTTSEIGADEAAIDTIFVLPDLSRYTRFMTGSQFSVGHAQHIVLSLLNSILSAAHGRLELSKLEGDAALFFVDADKLTPEEIGETVVDMFRAFFRERRRLAESNICPCRACSHISDLDLKIFVHRGNASRFTFRGAVDLFGTDVIVIHRMMKNNVGHHRYVMISDQAAPAIEFPLAGETSRIKEKVEHVGLVGATTIKLSDEVATNLSMEKMDDSPSIWMVVSETARKLSFNIASVTRFAGSGGRNRPV